MWVTHDKDFDEGVWAWFPPGSWIEQLIVRWMFLGKRASWWRFAPCGSDCKRRELPFA